MPAEQVLRRRLTRRRPQSHPLLAIWVADAPAQVLPIFHAAARAEVLKQFPAYDAIHASVFVRITDLPICDAIRDIRQSHLNALIRISGVVTRRTGVFPQLQSVKYDCAKCGFVIGPIVQGASQEIRVSHCPQCEARGGFTVNVEQTLYRNYQKMTLQESPGSVPAGRLPRSKEVVLLHDLIDCARPGEEVEVTGVFTNHAEQSLGTAAGFPVFATLVEANHVARRGDGGAGLRLTDEERAACARLAQDPAIARRLAASVAPSIHGHDDIKLALALALFGGQEKHVRGKARTGGGWLRLWRPLRSRARARDGVKVEGGPPLHAPHAPHASPRARRGCGATSTCCCWGTRAPPSPSS